MTLRKLLTDADLTTGLGLDDPSVAIALTGDIVAVGGAQLISVTGIVPADTLAALTLNFVDGITNGISIITCTQIITALTVTGNVNTDATRTVCATPTALTANQCMIWAWDESSSTACWIRLQ